VQVTSVEKPGLTIAGSEFVCYHSEFDKIMGDLRRPSSAVVFGEKGSGKTAIRLQISRRISEHNVANPGAMVLLVPYDDVNGYLDRLRADGWQDVPRSLESRPWTTSDCTIVPAGGRTAWPRLPGRRL
jgi:hypothetical protein